MCSSSLLGGEKVNNTIFCQFGTAPKCIFVKSVVLSIGCAEQEILRKYGTYTAT